MDVIIVCHTEFGLVKNKQVIYDKNSIEGVVNGAKNLVNIADKCGAKITFVVCPEVIESFPREIKHEIGLHIHSGWLKVKHQGISYYVGDKILKESCHQSINSTVLRDYPYEEQLEMITKGKEYLNEFGFQPKVFVAGRWSLDNNTIKALIQNGFTHDCSAVSNSVTYHYDWSKLPRICMPYTPNILDYQNKGTLHFLIVPISQMLFFGNVNPEAIPNVGLPWLKACFKEYYINKLPLFHICLHSPSMIDGYFVSAFENYLNYISKFKNVNFIYASEVKDKTMMMSRCNILPYIYAINRNLIKIHV